MTYGEFKSQIENAYKQRFPNSGISISLGALGEDTCFIRLYLGENQSEFINGIAGNDILHVGFAVYQNEDVYGDNPKLTDDLELPDTLIMKVYQNSITVIPDNPYMAYGSVSLPYRKTKGSPEKIIQVFSKDIDILKQTLEDLYNEGKIHDNHKEIVEKKLGLSSVNESIEFRSKTKNLLESFQNNLNETNDNTKYIVCSYYDYKLHDTEDELKTNDWTEATLFAHDKLMNGFMVEIENTITGKYKRINPDEYNEEFDGEFTIRPEELEESDSNETNDDADLEIYNKLKQYLLDLCDKDSRLIPDDSNKNKFIVSADSSQWNWNKERYDELADGTPKIWGTYMTKFTRYANSLLKPYGCDTNTIRDGELGAYALYYDADFNRLSISCVRDYAMSESLEFTLYFKK